MAKGKHRYTRTWQEVLLDAKRQYLYLRNLWRNHQTKTKNK